GSLSAPSNVTQANGRPSVSFHWPSTVVFPKPGGATSSTIPRCGTSLATSTSRVTCSARRVGARSLAPTGIGAVHARESSDLAPTPEEVTVARVLHRCLFEATGNKGRPLGNSGRSKHHHLGETGPRAMKGTPSSGNNPM